MKFILFSFLLSITSSLFADATSEKCFSISDEIDRKYCIDKYLQTVKAKLATEKKTWAKGLPGDAKIAKTEALEAELQAKKDQSALVAAEIALHEAQLKDLAAVAALTPAVAAPKKKEKKKDKPKFPFGIKL
jgi:hypothetical protein